MRIWGIGLLCLFFLAFGAVSTQSTSASSILQRYQNPAISPNCDVRPLTCGNQQNTPIGSWQRVLVIAAHPDDIETSAGGTVARLVDAGIEVRYVLLTNGDRGTQNRSLTPHALGIIRQQEQLAAAAALGVTSVDFLGLEDGSVMNTEATQLNVTRWIRKYKPNAIFTWNPALEDHFDLYLEGLQHSDHRATGQIVLDVVYPKIRDFLYFTELLSEGLEPWIVREVFMFNWQIDTSDPSSIFQVDITETFPLKASALLEHKSQISDPSAVVEDIMDMATVLAKASKPEMGFMSEWFKRVLFR